MRLELSQRVFGDSANNLDLRWGSSLSWSEHKALMASAAGSVATAQEAARARHTLEQLRFDVQDVINAVEILQTEIGLQLQDQTRLMTRQVELLAQIAETLRTPARTRAAERISDTGELLRRDRYDRALTLANQAIDDDPNNPAGFLAAAWASLELDDVERARDFFREAAQASDGDQRQSSLRRAVRLTFLLEGPQAALKELGDSPKQRSPAEEGATDFDRAVYFSNAGESTTAAECIRKASYHDGRFCLMALTDPILSRDATVAQMQGQLPELPYCGLNALPRWQAAARNAHAEVDQDERTLAERRREMALNKYLAREVDKGWVVVRRWKLHALIGKTTWWDKKAYMYPSNVREVSLDPSGKVISDNARVTNWGEIHGMSIIPERHTPVGVVVISHEDLDRSSYRPCAYCGCKEIYNQCQPGELALFPNEGLNSG